MANSRCLTPLSFVSSLHRGPQMPCQFPQTSLPTFCISVSLHNKNILRVCALPVTHHAMTTSNHTIPDRSLPGSTRTTPSARHQDGGVKYATGASLKIHGSDNIMIGSCKKRTLRPAGKLQELTHETDMCRWNILGLGEMRWKNFGKTTTEEGHKVGFLQWKRGSTRAWR